MNTKEHELIGTRYYLIDGVWEIVEFNAEAERPVKTGLLKNPDLSATPENIERYVSLFEVTARFLDGVKPDNISAVS